MNRSLPTLAAAALVILSGLTLALPEAASGSVLPGLAAPGSDDAWARAVVATLPRATAVNDADGNKLFDDLDRAFLVSGPMTRLPVIVSFVHGVESDEGVARVASAAPSAPVDHVFRIIPAYAGALNPQEALAVARLPEVRQIELDREGFPELETSTVFSGARAVTDEMGITGNLDGDAETFSAKDVVVAILDTGFDVGHVDLAEGKLIAFYDVGYGEKEPYDTGSHGTHVASIVAGLGRGQGDHRGVAPGAAIVGIQITGGSAGTTSNAMKGYEWLVENKEELGVRIATMSFGFGIATDGTTALERTVDAVWDAGIVAFKSNGNSGPGRGTMTVPAAARGIIGVGAMLDPAGHVNGADFGFQLAGFSSRGPTTDGRVKPDIVAPGVSILAAQSGTKDEYVAFSGTSMAAPFAAGTAALVIAANPALTPDEVRDILRSTTEDWGLEGADIDYGYGRLQVREAVREAFLRANREAPASTPPAVPFHEVRAGMTQLPFAEGTFVVEDTTHPIAATFITEGLLTLVEIRDPSDGIVGTLVPTQARQAVISFEPTTTGTYSFRIVAPLPVPYVVDFSHGSAMSLIDLPVGPLEGSGVEDLGSRFNVPAPGAILLLFLAVAIALVRRR